MDWGAIPKVKKKIIVKAPMHKLKKQEFLSEFSRSFTHPIELKFLALA